MQARYMFQFVHTVPHIVPLSQCVTSRTTIQIFTLVTVCVAAGRSRQSSFAAAPCSQWHSALLPATCPECRVFQDREHVLLKCRKYRP